MNKLKNGSLKGAIVGDIVGSIYEFNNNRTKDFPFFTESRFFTDDSVMSIAVAHAIALWNGWSENDELKGDTLANTFVRCMQKFGRLYPDESYGGHFAGWIRDKDPEPYNSWGNGAPMRCSAAGMFGESAEEANKQGKATSEVTHNHKYALDAAGLTAEIIWRARYGERMEQLEELAREHYYKGRPDYPDYEDIETCDWYKVHNRFSEASHKTMPPALAAFLESTSFEDCIRNAVYVGGDTDTIGAIAGAMAEAYWGIPNDIWAKAESYLDERLKKIVSGFYAATVENEAEVL